VTGQGVRQPKIIPWRELGRIPTGGGWRIHGHGTDAARASKRTGAGTGKVGYTYLDTAIDDHSRLAYTETLDDERAMTAATFWHRAVAFFAAYDISSIRRVLTGNGSCYRSQAWAGALAETRTKHKRTRPYAPRTNGKVERFNGTLAREWAYVRAYTSEHERRAALADFLNFYNHERLHAALGGRPPISRASGSDYHVRPAAGTARHGRAAARVREPRGTNVMRHHTLGLFRGEAQFD